MDLHIMYEKCGKESRFPNILGKHSTEDPCCNDIFVPQDFAIKKNLPLYKIPTCTSIINDKKPFFPLIYSKKHILRVFIRIALLRHSNKY